MNDPTAVTGNAVREIATLAERAALVQVQRFGDYEFTDRPVQRVDVDPKGPEPREFYTLAAFATYLKAEGESDLLVHVMTPERVDAVSKLYGRDRNLRRIPARAVYRGQLQGFSFGTPVTMDALSIALQTCFEPKAGQVEALRQFCASVRSTNEVGVDDDGVSQVVAAKSGIAAVKTTPVNNPWLLAPWRTFAEVEQPTSPFILRFKQADEPQGGLYETGDGSWRVEAVKRIAAFLRAQLGTGWTVLG